VLNYGWFNTFINWRSNSLTSTCIVRLVSELSMLFYVLGLINIVNCMSNSSRQQRLPVISGPVWAQFKFEWRREHARHDIVSKSRPTKSRRTPTYVYYVSCVNSLTSFSVAAFRLWIGRCKSECIFLLYRLAHIRRCWVDQFDCCRGRDVFDHVVQTSGRRRYRSSQYLDWTPK
jgi:hypothetical protein